MATQDNEEGKGGIFGGLKKAPGYAYAKAKQAANAYGVAGTIAASVGGHVSPVIPAFMYARQKYDEHRRGEAIKERRTADPNYNAEADSTLPEVRHMYGAPISDIYNAAFNPIETTKRLLTKVTGRDSAEEPNELPQVVDDADLGISEGRGFGAEDVGITAPSEPGYAGFDGPVDYSLSDEDSTGTMGLNMDEGVGATNPEKYDHYGFPTEYVGDYDNADAEMRELLLNPDSRNFKDAKDLRDRRDYLNALLNKAKERKTDAESATPGGGQSSTGSRTKDTASRPGYDRTNNRGITGSLELSAIPHARSQEIQNGRIVLKGTVYNIVGNTGDKFLVPDPDQPDYSRRA